MVSSICLNIHVLECNCQFLLLDFYFVGRLLVDTRDDWRILRSDDSENGMSDDRNDDDNSIVEFFMYAYTFIRWQVYLYDGYTCSHRHIIMNHDFYSCRVIDAFASTSIDRLSSDRHCSIILSFVSLIVIVLFQCIIQARTCRRHPLSSACKMIQNSTESEE